MRCLLIIFVAVMAIAIVGTVFLFLSMYQVDLTKQRYWNDQHKPATYQPVAVTTDEPSDKPPGIELGRFYPVVSSMPACQPDKDHSDSYMQNVINTSARFGYPAGTKVLEGLMDEKKCYRVESGSYQVLEWFSKTMVQGVPVWMAKVIFEGSSPEMDNKTFYYAPINGSTLLRNPFRPPSHQYNANELRLYKI